MTMDPKVITWPWEPRSCTAGTTATSLFGHFWDRFCAVWHAFARLETVCRDSPSTWPRSPAEWCSCCVSRSPCGFSVWPPSSLLVSSSFLGFRFFGGIFLPLPAAGSRSCPDGASERTVLSTYSKSPSPAPHICRNSVHSRIKFLGVLNSLPVLFAQIKSSMQSPFLLHYSRWILEAKRH